MKILITGFDGFGKDDYNPTFEAIKQLADSINNHQIIKLQLPTKYIEAKMILEHALSMHQPDLILLTGQAAGRDKISLEKVALNVMHSKIDDNANYRPKDVEIIADEDFSLLTEIDVITLANELNNQEVPAEVSYHAGTFVCNSTYFSLLHLIKHNYKNSKGLFIHVPIIPSQAKNYRSDTPTIELSEITRSFETIIKILSD